MPRQNRDHEVVAARRARLREPHIAPLTALVERMQRALPDAHVPWFDPDSGGVDARVLILLEAPGPLTTARPRGRRRGSGFVSMDNDDPTAEFMQTAYLSSGLARAEGLLWNVVPWYIGTPDGARIRAAATRDSIAAEHYLEELIEMLPALEIVVLMGRKAQAAWQRFARRRAQPDRAVLRCPHPSIRGRRNGGDDMIRATLATAVAMLSGGRASSR